jgi:iron complex outermembrane receptor protein
MTIRPLHLFRFIPLAALLGSAVAFAAADGSASADAIAADTANDVVHLDDFSVSGEPAKNYAAAVTNSSKLDLPLLENPQNIQVIPRALLEDQQVVTLADALKNVAGVMPGGYYENWDYYRIRGFAADFNSYIDGLRGPNGMGEETFGLEQIEVIKGPASSLFGQGPLSGLVNLVSKHPRDEFFARSELTYGSYDYREATLDLNTPLGSGHDLLLRLPVLWREHDSFVDQASLRTKYLAPALTWKPSRATTITFLGKYKESDVVHAMPLPAEGTILPNPNGSIPLDRFVGEPGANRAYENSGQIGYELTHRFSETVTLRQNLRYDRVVQGWRDLLYPAYLGADERTLYLYPYNYWQDWRDFAVDTRLEITRQTGAITHQFVGGVDHYRKDYGARWQTIDFSDPAAYTALDLYTPEYGTLVLAYQPIASSRSETRNTGFYLHDHVKLGYGVTLTAGGRYDRTKSDGVQQKKFSPRAGLTWEFRPGAVFYANYSRSFNPQGSYLLTADSRPVVPETGENWEAGVKTAAADGRLTGTLAIFQLTRQNVATADLTHPGYYLVSGEQRSRGIELDCRLSPAPGWEITAGYAYTDARITRDNILPVGERTNGVPYNALTAWTKYTFQRGALRGFAVGLGARYYSAQVGDETHTQYFEIPPYGLVDAAVYYSHGRFTAQLNVNNLFDRTYYSGAYNALYVLPAAPRTLRVSAGWKF